MTMLVATAVCLLVAAVVSAWWLNRQHPAGTRGAEWWTCPRCRFLWHTVSPQRPVCPACGVSIEDDD